ncbi:MAG: CoA transferase [Planctomycetota bacterium]
MTTTDPSMPHSADRSQPLAEYRVLDLTTFLSGPYCTQVLADLGADVVKVESPAGDSSRHIPPHFVGDDSAYFLANNRNKRSLAVDLKHPRGVELLRRLINSADVVVENYRPGVLARLGIDVSELLEQQPRLIWASISGFGQNGPNRDRPAYDMIVQAMSGAMSLTGEPGRPAARLGIPAGDTVAGLYAAIAINAALADRERTGHGRQIDVAMLDCQLSMLSYQSAYALIGGVTPGPQGAGHDSIPTYRSFTGRDSREFVVTANTEKMWLAMCRVIEREVLTNDPRFTDGKSRHRNREELWGILEPSFAERDANEWVDRLVEAGVPAAMIKNVPEALEEARTSERDMICEMKTNEGRSIEVVGNPIHFVDGQSDARRATYPPTLGADASSIFADWLEADASRLAELFDTGVLSASDDRVNVTTQAAKGSAS